jgi:hypothetical protein
MEANRIRSKVHRLPTENGVIFKNRTTGTLVMKISNVAKKLYPAQHLYFTTDEEIKEGDWTISKNNELSQTFGYLGRYKEEGYRKIIATTNSNIKMFTGIENLDTARSYPQPSQAFIKAYCEQGGFDEVDVEYTTDELRCYKCNKSETDCINTSKNCIGFFEDNNKVKVDPIHNTITTHRIKDSWNTNEIKKAFYLEDLRIESSYDKMWECFINRLSSNTTHRIVEKMYSIDDIEAYCDKYPNDTELGREIRKLRYKQ